MEPSTVNILIRWCRCMPMARDMPISVFRSAASMEKIRKISSSPTPMENRPKVVKKETKRLPTSFAVSSTSCLMGMISSPWPSISGWDS